MMKFFPDRKVWAGGIAAVLAWFIIGALEKYGHVTLTPDMRTMITGMVATAISYIVPPTTRDIIKRLDDNLVAIAMADPKIPVTGIPPAAVNTIVTGPGVSAKMMPIILAVTLLVPLAACQSPAPAKPDISAAVAAPDSITAEQKWAITCQFADAAYLTYVAFAKPKPGDATAEKVAAGYDAVKVICSARPDNYAAALVTLLGAYSAFQQALPPKPKVV